jgi:hypothetical protein
MLNKFKGFLRGELFQIIKLIISIISVLYYICATFALLLVYGEEFYFLICFSALICSYFFNLKQAFSIIESKI